MRTIIVLYKLREMEENWGWKASKEGLAVIKAKSNKNNGRCFKEWPKKFFVPVFSHPSSPQNVVTFQSFDKFWHPDMIFRSVAQSMVLSFAPREYRTISAESHSKLSAAKSATYILTLKPKKRFNFRLIFGFGSELSFC